VGPIYWGPPSCEELLCSCCIGVVQESNSFVILVILDQRCNHPIKITKTSAFPTTIGKRKRNTTWPG
jgi:hypothetical protein